MNYGVYLDSIDFLLAKARKAERANIVEEVAKGRQEEVKETRRCKWCSFVHPKEDCQDHLQGR